MSALATQPAEKAALEKPRVEPIGLRPAVWACHRNARWMNDVALDALRSEPASQPEAVVSGFKRHGDAFDPVAFLFGLRPPAAQQLEQCVLVDREFLERLTLHTRNNASEVTNPGRGGASSRQAAPPASFASVRQRPSDARDHQPMRPA
jgi:hypothetical protein